MLQWWGEDSNLRRLCQQIYSLPRLTASVPHRLSLPEPDRIGAPAHFFTNRLDVEKSRPRPLGRRFANELQNVTGPPEGVKARKRRDRKASSWASEALDPPGEAGQRPLGCDRGIHAARPISWILIKGTATESTGESLVVAPPGMREDLVDLPRIGGRLSACVFSLLPRAFGVRSFRCAGGAGE